MVYEDSHHAQCDRFLISYLIKQRSDIEYLSRPQRVLVAAKKFTLTEMITLTVDERPLTN